MLVADGLGPEWIGCYGGESVATPHIDALAARGVKFHNVYSMPRPRASQSTLLTGRYPHRHVWAAGYGAAGSGREHWFDWNQNMCLARLSPLLRYRSGVVGQWLLNDLEVQPDALLQHGFWRWCVCEGTHSATAQNHGGYWNPHLNLSGPLSRDDDGLPNRDTAQTSWGLSGTFDGKFGPDLFNRFLHAQPFGRSATPFCIYYAMNLPGSTATTLPGAGTAGGETDRYRDLVRYTDQLVGEAIGWLEGKRQLDRTMVIFTGVGGAPANVVARAGGREIPGGRGTLSERGIRVPLIVSCPGLTPAGVESENLVDFTDLAPTLCDIATLGRRFGGRFDGRSFWPVLIGEQQSEPRTWIMSLGDGALAGGAELGRDPHQFAQRVLRDHRFKAHVNTQHEIDALWDLHDDPDEERNLINSAVSRHRRAIEKFQAVMDEMRVEDAVL